MAQPSREGTFAASDRATRAQGNEPLPRNPTSGSPAGHNKRRPTCDGNFAPTESQISYI